MTTSASLHTATEPSQVAKPPVEPDPGAAPEAPVEPAMRHQMIAEAAFFLAQSRGFTPSQELDDWLAAEREIERRLSGPDH
jgi:Protein of unknown function (DUF2934)